MKRPIITVDDISAALREKKTALSVPYNCVVSPAANDMAFASNLTINREPCPAQEAKKQGGVVVRSAVGAGHKPPADQDKILAEIRAKVLAKLPVELHNNAVVDELIRKHLEASGCGCDICRPVATGRPAAVCPEPAAPADAWKNAAAGALHINSAKLPWKDFSGGGPAGAAMENAVVNGDLGLSAPILAQTHGSAVGATPPATISEPTTVANIPFYVIT